MFAEIRDDIRTVKDLCVEYYRIYRAFYRLGRGFLSGMRGLWRPL
jgi:hypothetical protein